MVFWWRTGEPFGAGRVPSGRGRRSDEDGAEPAEAVGPQRAPTARPRLDGCPLPQAHQTAASAVQDPGPVLGDEERHQDAHPNGVGAAVFHQGT